MEENIQEITELSNMSVTSIQQFVEKAVDGGFNLGRNILVAVVVYFVGQWIVNKIIRLCSKLLRAKNVEPSLRGFLENLICISLRALLIIVIIGLLGIETSSFIALFASAGVAVGMALSGTLQNFAGGVMILLFRPFKVGDFIEAQGYSGTVKEIKIFSTIINTVDNQTIIIPNNQLSNAMMKNYSQESKRRVDITVSVAYGTSYEETERELREICAKDSRILKDPDVFVGLLNMADSSIDFTLRAWVKSEDYWGVFFDLNKTIYTTFTEKGINIPFPQMDVHLVKE